MNLGLAWDLTTPITETAGRLADYIPPAIATGANAVTGQLLVANQGGVNASAGINMYWADLEPRIGAAYKVPGQR